MRIASSTWRGEGGGRRAGGGSGLFGMRASPRRGLDGLVRRARIVPPRLVGFVRSFAHLSEECDSCVAVVARWTRLGKS
jgi:hypothetical protein